MISTYTCDGGKIRISTPYCQDIVDTCRKWAGKFQDGAWVVPATRLGDVQALLGSTHDDLVEVEVAPEHWEGRAQIHVGWYVLAGRRSRDHGADVYADLVAGEIPPWGGSVKSPAVMATEDARFRLWVPRDFAVARDLPIVTDPRAAVEPTAIDPDEIRQIASTLASAVYYGEALRCLLHTSPEALDAARRLVALIVDDFPAECLTHKAEIA